MRKASTGRKIARAAATGGGRTNRGRAPLVWYLSLVLIVVLGLGVVAFSRYQHDHPATSTANTTPPTTSDHWLAAFAFNICGAVQPNPPAPSNPTAITTQGDGVIHINPTSSQNSGNNATLGRFVAGYPSMLLTSTEVRYPGQATHANGQPCGAQPGQVQVKVWSSLADPKGHLVSGDPSNLKLQNGQLITIAFVPAGATIDQPPSKTNLAAPTSPTTQPGAASGSP
jgi:hypothetical protein